MFAEKFVRLTIVLFFALLLVGCGESTPSSNTSSINGSTIAVQPTLNVSQGTIVYVGVATALIQSSSVTPQSPTQPGSSGFRGNPASTTQPAIVAKDVQVTAAALAPVNLPDAGKLQVLSWSPNGKFLAVASTSHAATGSKIYLLSPDGQTVATLNGAFKPVAWSPDSQFLVTGHEAGSTKVAGVATPQGDFQSWNVDGKLITNFNLKDNIGGGFSGGISDDIIAWSPDGKQLAIKTQKDIQLWSKDGKLTSTLQRTGSFTWSSDSKLIAVGSGGSTVYVYDASSGEGITKLHDDKPITDKYGYKSPSDLTPVQIVSWIPNSQNLVFGDTIDLQVWNVNGENSKLLSYVRIEGFVQGPILSPNGKLMATWDGKDYSTEQVWDINCTLIATLKGFENIASSGSNNVQLPVWSPDSNVLAISYVDKTIRLYSVNGKVLTTLKGLSGIVTTLTWSGDGSTLAATLNDGTIKLWKIAIS